jgi:hypothetical protein
MTRPTIFLTAYLALGLFVALITVLRSKKVRGFGPSEEPALFWLYLLFWPVMFVVRVRNTKQNRGDGTTSSPDHPNTLPNQLPDPTSPSVTPAAGAAGAPSVAADH